MNNRKISNDLFLINSPPNQWMRIGAIHDTLRPGTLDAIVQKYTAGVSAASYVAGILEHLDLAEFDRNRPQKIRLSYHFGKWSSTLTRMIDRDKFLYTRDFFKRLGLKWTGNFRMTVPHQRNANITTKKNLKNNCWIFNKLCYSKTLRTVSRRS